jgi:probable HAF family extracellular repeat protein
MKSFARISKILFTSLFTFVLFNKVEAQQLIAIQPSGAEGGVAYGVNDSLQVVGQFTTANGDAVDGFVYSSGTVTNLGSLGGGPTTGSSINNAGQIAGTSATSNGYPAGFLYSGGTMTNIGNLGYPYTYGYGINNSGSIVGASATASGYLNAFLYSGGVMENLGTLGGLSSGANAINNLGQVVGYADLTNGTPVAFLYSGGVMSNLGSLPGLGGGSNAMGINDLGQVVGWSDVGPNLGAQTAFLYSDGTMIDLGSGNYSEATDINNSGEVVGWDSVKGAFVYSTGSGLEYLDAQDASLLVSGGGSQRGFTEFVEANAVNNLGDIVGEGLYWNGSSYSDQAFLLEPASVPEPTSCSMLLGGVIALIFWRTRTKRLLSLDLPATRCLRSYT